MYPKTQTLDGELFVISYYWEESVFTRNKVTWKLTQSKYSAINIALKSHTVDLEGYI